MEVEVVARAEREGLCVAGSKSQIMNNDTFWRLSLLWHDAMSRQDRIESPPSSKAEVAKISRFTDANTFYSNCIYKYTQGRYSQEAISNLLSQYSKVSQEYTKPIDTL